MKILKTALTLVTLLFSNSVWAENIQATQCQIYVKQVWAAPNTHSSASLEALVQVGPFVSGEYIQKVGFYGKLIAKDLGNAPECHATADSRADGKSQVFDHVQNSNGLNMGEFEFGFPITSGSVVSTCPGYDYSNEGTFFVETNKNTYWLNPSLDPKQSFVLDRNGYERLHAYEHASTLRADLRYYNPVGCQN